jgi:hypothetical protein
LNTTRRITEESSGKPRVPPNDLPRRTPSGYPLTDGQALGSALLRDGRSQDAALAVKNAAAGCAHLETPPAAHPLFRQDQLSRATSRA